MTIVCNCSACVSALAAGMTDLSDLHVVKSIKGQLVINTLAFVSVRSELVFVPAAAVGIADL